MTKTSLSKKIINEFGDKLYQKSFNFPNNKINIIYLREQPIKIRSIILDNEREFHLIIDEKNGEIFHDCPLFLIHSERSEKICVHLIKLLMIIKNSLALKILENLENYLLTSEDFGSQKKSKNYLLLANTCFETNNCVEALSYLNKAIINQFESEEIIEKYLINSIENNLFIEFFEFLRFSYENELATYFIKYNNHLKKGFKRFMTCISDYSFFNLLRIIESIDKILEFNNILYELSFRNKLKELVNSKDFNEKYFSIYFIKRNLENLIKIDPSFNKIPTQDQLDSLRESLLSYFFSEIDNFCVIEKLKLLKEQFQIIDIPKTKFYNDYKKYKEEIKELEKKVYIKKFAYLKILIEKYYIKKSKGEFRKIRNTYRVKHDDDNLKNPVYYYIIARIGFSGIDEQIIKSSEIGINYFIIKELFVDDLSNLPDVNYYREQFWGEIDDYEIKSLDGFSLLSTSIDYGYDIDQKYSNDVMIIEWDLASKPIQGSIVNAYGNQIIIPDQNNPLFHDLKPFDLCYCKKTPAKIEGNIIKTINIITKCSFKDAIKSVSRGMPFIEGYYPLSLVKNVLNKEISPFHAIDIVVNNPNKLFIPNYNQFIIDFKEFLFNFINKEKEYVFEELKINYKIKSNQILILLNLTNELAGLDLPYPELIKELLDEDINFEEFKSKFLNKVHTHIQKILDKREIGSTIIFNLNELRNTQFFKYTNEIIKVRKEEFESSKIIQLYYKKEKLHDVSEISKTYYGKKFIKILNMEGKIIFKPDKFNQFIKYAKKLNLKLNIKADN
ncbi:MAG: hypothetical protein ACFE8L_07395 [Candidatus Hodarchaeota archaeon]